MYQISNRKRAVCDGADVATSAQPQFDGGAFEIQAG